MRLRWLLLNVGWCAPARAEIVCAAFNDGNATWPSAPAGNPATLATGTCNLNFYVPFGTTYRGCSITGVWQPVQNPCLRTLKPRGGHGRRAGREGEGPGQEGEGAGGPGQEGRGKGKGVVCVCVCVREPGVGAEWKASLRFRWAPKNQQAPNWVFNRLNSCSVPCDHDVRRQRDLGGVQDGNNTERHLPAWILWHPDTHLRGRSRRCGRHVGRCPAAVQRYAIVTARARAPAPRAPASASRHRRRARTCVPSRPDSDRLCRHQRCCDRWHPGVVPCDPGHRGRRRNMRRRAVWLPAARLQPERQHRRGRVGVVPPSQPVQWYAKHRRLGRTRTPG